MGTFHAFVIAFKCVLAFFFHFRGAQYTLLGGHGPQMPPLGAGPDCVQLKIAQSGKKEKVPCQHNRGTGNVLNDPAVLKEREGKKMEGASC